MPNLEQHVDFNPEKDIQSLQGKVLFITGGTNGLGKETVKALARHEPAQIYFSGRNAEAGKNLIRDIQKNYPNVGLTFVKMDMESLADVKKACAQFTHDRLDFLMCNAGVMYIPPGLSQDGYEKTFAICHLAHAMMIQQLLPVMEKTAKLPNSDVRIVSLTSTGYMGHPRDGVSFSTLKTTQDSFMGTTFRYGQSKLANILYPAEFARRYPNSNIKAIAVHPGASTTDLTTNISLIHKLWLKVVFWYLGVSMMTIEQGRLSQLWTAYGGKKEELVNGGYYMPIGRFSNDRLDKTAKSEVLARELWDYTEDVLSKF